MFVIVPQEEAIDSVGELRGLVTIGDSISMPRPGKSDAANFPVEAWPHLLASRLEAPWHWHIGQRGSRCQQILEGFEGIRDYLDSSTCRVIVLQFGVVDCTPRPAPRSVFQTISIVERFGLGKKLTSTLNSSSLLYKIWGKPWVNVRQFEKCVNRLLQSILSQGIPVLVSEVFQPSGNLLRVTGRSLVDDYNSVLRKVIDQHDDAHLLKYSPLLLADGYHFTKADHAEFAKIAADTIVRLRNHPC